MVSVVCTQQSDKAEDCQDFRVGRYLVDARLSLIRNFPCICCGQIGISTILKILGPMA